MASFIHPTAEVAETASVGEDTKIWALVQIRDQVRIGRNCNIGRNVFIDVGVTLGDNCKVQNNALLYEGVTLEDGVFVGPAVCFTNDKLPRAINSEGGLKNREDWTLSRTLVKYGAAIGAQSVIVTGITLGRFCLIGSGAVVTRDVEDYTLVVGNPARLVGYVCRCGQRLISVEDQTNNLYNCGVCSRSYLLIAGKISEQY